MNFLFILSSLLILVIISIVLNICRPGRIITIVLNATILSTLFGLQVIIHDKQNLYPMSAALILLCIIIYMFLFIANVNKYYCDKVHKEIY